jgi:hypothetical protein
MLYRCTGGKDVSRLNLMIPMIKKQRFSCAKGPLRFHFDVDESRTHLKVKDYLELIGIVVPESSLFKIFGINLKNSRCAIDLSLSLKT